MGNTMNLGRPLGTAMVGGALAMAILDLLVSKKVLTLDDVQSALKTAQRSLISSPTVAGSMDGARIIGAISEQITTRQRDNRNGYRC